MKRSTYVQLILLGSGLGLYACDAVRQDIQQQRYGSLDECRHDWGDPADCRQSSGVTGPGYYFGPRYYWDPNLGRPMAVSADGTTRAINDAHITRTGSLTGITSRVGSISRGGFGASAHGFFGGRGGG